MLKEKDRKTLFILAAISIVLCLAVCVPFSLKGISLFEIIFKYVVVALFIVGASILGISIKFRNYRPCNKYSTIVTYTPLFSYAAALLFNAVLNLVRGGALFGSLQMVMLIVASAILVAVICLSHLYYKAVLSLTKNEAMFVDGLFVVLTALFFVFALMIANKLRNAGALPASSQQVLFIIVPLVLGLATGALVCFSLNYLRNSNEEYSVQSREELVQLWKDNVNKRSEVYDVAREEILNALADFVGGELGNEEVEEQPSGVGSTPDEEVEELRRRIDELETELVLQPLKKALEVIENEQREMDKVKAKVEEEYPQQIAELQAIVDEYEAKLAAEEEARRQAEEEERLARERRAQEALEREKNKKPIEPAFEEFVNFAKEIGKDRDDMAVKVNDKQTQYKITCHGKNVLTLLLTKNDYKITVSASNEEMRSILYQYTAVANFDRTTTLPVSGYQLQSVKISYKGDGSIEADAIKDLMAKSLDALLTAEAAEDEAKAEEKARKDRAALAERTLRKQERAEERAAQKAAEEEAKRQAEAEEKAQAEKEAQEAGEQPAEEAPQEEPKEANE